MMRRKGKFLLGIIVLVALLIGGAYLNGVDFNTLFKKGINVLPPMPEVDESIPARSDFVQASVVRVVDGDTVVVRLNGNDTKIRLIGVNTPESVASQEYLDKTGKENTKEGKAASDWLKAYLKVGTTVYLEYDVQQTDKYGRLLAYIWLTNHVSEFPTVVEVRTEMLNGILLENGYAQIATYPPNVKYVDIFKVLNKPENTWK